MLFLEDKALAKDVYLHGKSYDQLLQTPQDGNIARVRG
jgi:hypothetical protein